MSLAHEAGLGQQHHERVGEHEHHDQVGDRGEAEGEREAAHVADGHEVQHDGGQQVHGLGRGDRPLGALPALVHGDGHGVARAQLVLDAFEVDDERVRRQTDRHDEPGDAREGQAVVVRPAQDRDGQPRQHARHDDRGEGQQAQGPVLEELVHGHEAEADQTGDQAPEELVSAERGGDLLLGLDREGDRQGAVVELLGQLRRRLLVQGGAADLRAAVGDDHVGLRRGDHVPVQQDRELLARVALGVRGELLGDLREGLGALLVEVDVDDPLVGGDAALGLGHAVGRALDLGARDDHGAQDVLLGRRDDAVGELLGGLAGDDRPVGRRRGRGRVPRGGAVLGLELGQQGRGDPVRVVGVRRLPVGLRQLVFGQALVLGGGLPRAGLQHGAELHVRGRLDQAAGLLVRDPGQGDDHVLGALRGDLRLGHAGAVHTLADDLHGLVQLLGGDGLARRGLGGQHHLRAALEVEGELGSPGGRAGGHAAAEDHGQDHEEGGQPGQGAPGGAGGCSLRHCSGASVTSERPRQAGPRVLGWVGLRPGRRGADAGRRRRRRGTRCRGRHPDATGPRWARRRGRRRPGPPTRRPSRAPRRW
ncbi:hypothetical protein AU359_00064 [Micrococcus luteus]|nr:hypothetical protein AU359_00064 [Micrococcus luteus]